MFIYIYFVSLLALIVLVMFLDPRPKTKKGDIVNDDK